jgi:AAA family ATP:ADP antiporter
MTEVLWKAQLKEIYPTAKAYTQYMSKITFFIGILATFSSYFISGNVIRHFGWKKTALITPIIIIFTGIGFFYFLFLKQYLSSSLMIFGMTPLYLSALFGSIQNIFARASKYTVFDDTKEIAFIPLSAENKIKGKSAIDGIGSRLGKSGSSLIIQLLLIVFVTPSACALVISILVFSIVPFWMMSINILNKKFQKITSETSEKDIIEEF